MFHNVNDELLIGYINGNISSDHHIPAVNNEVIFKNCKKREKQKLAVCSLVCILLYVIFIALISTLLYPKQIDLGPKKLAQMLSFPRSAPFNEAFQLSNDSETIFVIIQGSVQTKERYHQTAIFVLQQAQNEHLKMQQSKSSFAFSLAILFTSFFILLNHVSTMRIHCYQYFSNTVFIIFLFSVSAVIKFLFFYLFYFMFVKALTSVEDYELPRVIIKFSFDQ